jgi:hypothetical protein
MNPSRVASLAAAAGSAHGYNQLRALAQQLLDQGVPAGDLLAELQQVRSMVPEDVEDLVVLEVMDILSGWCAPHRRLVPRTAADAKPRPAPGRDRG